MPPCSIVESKAQCHRSPSPPPHLPLRSLAGAPGRSVLWLPPCSFAPCAGNRSNHAGPISGVDGRREACGFSCPVRIMATVQHYEMCATSGAPRRAHRTTFALTPPARARRCHCLGVCAAAGGPVRAPAPEHEAGPIAASQARAGLPIPRRSGLEAERGVGARKRLLGTCGDAAIALRGVSRLMPTLEAAEAGQLRGQ